MGMVGYSTYAPAKHALRGLADTLRSELALYAVGVHIFFPPTMYSPGYELENRTKPAITLKIEEADKGMSCADAARGMLDGVKRGRAHITADFITNVFRASTRGASPYNNVVWDSILSCIGSVRRPPRPCLLLISLRRLRWCSGAAASTSSSRRTARSTKSTCSKRVSGSSSRWPQRGA